MIFLGRLHPVVLHFPIALLSVAFVLVLAARSKRFAGAEPASGILVDLGAITAVLTAVFGVLLGQEGRYAADLLGLHRLWGVVLAVVAVFLALIRRRGSMQRAYLPMFVATMGLLVWVGHLGGTLTHGPNYLSAHAPAPVRMLLGVDAAPAGGGVQVDDVEEALVLEELILPVLERACTECHNPIEHRGGLDLTDAAGLFTGSEDGPVVSDRGALESELFRRLILPADHDDAMPPSGRSRLHPVAVELIGWWLDRGASAEARIRDLGAAGRRLRVLRERFERGSSLAGVPIDPASSRAVARANRGPFIVEPVARNDPHLRARLRTRDPGLAVSLRDLRSVRDQLVELDLRNSPVDDDDLTGLAAFRHLQRLALQNTAVTDVGLREVSQLEYLEDLNVHGTGVSDAGLRELAGLQHIRRIHAWNSRVTEQGREAAEALNPRLQVGLGIDSLAFASTRLPEPDINVDSVLFVERATVTLTGFVPNAQVFYTVDGNTPDTNASRYTSPFSVTRSTRIRAVAVKDGWVMSDPSEVSVLARGVVPVSISLTHEPNPEYPGEGAETLTDGVLGTVTHRSPQWLGFDETDLVATMDLGAVSRVGSVAVSFLENTGAWIFPPTHVEVFASTDGLQFQRVSSEPFEQPEQSRTAFQDVRPITFDVTDARWIRVIVGRVPTLPDWHPGSGKPAWVFVDEVVVGAGPG